MRAARYSNISAIYYKYDIYYVVEVKVNMHTASVHLPYNKLTLENAADQRVMAKEKETEKEWEIFRVISNVIFFTAPATKINFHAI